MSSRSPGERASPDLAERLAERIAAHGPIPVADYMALANAHYYATRDPLGAAGDFITAPEISQMFGELVGAWLADLWIRAGHPREAVYVELGPGRGTLAADALRVMAKAGFAPKVHFVETSPVLRAAQAVRALGAVWHDAVDTLPADAPLLIVANEFFDALPVRQLVSTTAGWRERAVAVAEEGFFATVGASTYNADVPDHLRNAALGSIVELCPAASGIVSALAARLSSQGGAMLIVDYGHGAAAAGDTLQAVHAHAFAAPFAAPGERDLTAHVDFAALAKAAGAVAVHGPVGQGAWLETLGIDQRAAALAARSPERANEIEQARLRLTAPKEMGDLFKVMAFTAPGWPTPAGSSAVRGKHPRPSPSPCGDGDLIAQP